MTQNSTNDAAYKRIDQLAEEVFRVRPVLGKTYHKAKDLSLLEFTQKQYDLLDSVVPKELQEEVISAISEYAGKILGKSVEDSVKEQLREDYFVITADHHGPITHPDFVNSNLLNSFALQNSLSTTRKNLIILSVANVSFDNFSFPRGHLFHSHVNNEVVMNKLPFFGYKIHSYSVFNFPAYTEEILKQMKRRLDTWVGQQVIDRNKKTFLSNFIDDIYGREAALSQKNFSEQMTETNYYLWNKLFEKEVSNPNLLYLEIESVVTELLIRFHISGDSIVNKLIFDDRYHRSMLRHFDGITAAFTTRDNSGTFLFWATPKDQKYRLSLWKKGNSLVSHDGSYSIELTPEAIGRALREREIIPSTLLSFILLSFYYGLVLVGGGGQTTYLTKMKDAYVQILNDVGDGESISKVTNIPTDMLSFPYPSIAFLKGAKDNTIPSTMLDLFLFKDEDQLNKIRKMAEAITFGQGLLREMPGLYRMLVPEEEQNRNLLSLTVEEIDEATGFNEVISPYFDISKS